MIAERDSEGKTAQSKGQGSAVCNGHTHLCQPTEEIRTRDQNKAFSKLLREEYSEQGGDPTVFNFKVIRTFEKPVEWQVAESVTIHCCKADQVLNSKSVWEQPATEQLVVTRELPAQEEVCERGRDRGRGRGGRRTTGAQ